MLRTDRCELLEIEYPIISPQTGPDTSGLKLV
jgi:hypothetical protein